MTNADLDAWLANWSRWLHDTADCYPQDAGIGSAEADYRCPQRWHHGTEPPASPPIYPVQAELVERSVHGDDFPASERTALIVAWVRLPDQRLLAARVPTALWQQKRASKAAMAVRSYLGATNRARSRLASILAPWRGCLP